MKEALSAAVDERVGEEGRVAALDDLEMVCYSCCVLIFLTDI